MLNLNPGSIAFKKLLNKLVILEKFYMYRKIEKIAQEFSYTLFPSFLIIKLLG